MGIVYANRWHNVSDRRDRDIGAIVSYNKLKNNQIVIRLLFKIN